MSTQRSLKSSSQSTFTAWLAAGAAALTLLSASPAGAEGLVVNSFPSAGSVIVGNSPGVDWVSYGENAVAVTWDPAQASPANPNAGAMYVTVDWPTPGSPNYTTGFNSVVFAFSTAGLAANEEFNSANLLAFDCDIKVDVANSYPATDGSYGVVELAVNPWEPLVLAAPLQATNGWQHITGYFSAIPPGLYAGAVVGLASEGTSILTNKVSYWIDNIVFSQAPISTAVIDSFDGPSTVQIGNSPGLDWDAAGTNPVAITWDPKQTSPSNPNSGSMYVTVDWPGLAGGNPVTPQAAVFSFSTASLGVNEEYYSSNFISFEFDIKVDVTNSYLATDGTYGAIELTVNPWSFLITSATLAATNGWQHFAGYFSSIPNAAYAGANIGLLSIGNSALTNKAAYWIDNVVFRRAPPSIPTHPVSVLTYHNDNARTGQMTNEIALTPISVNTNTFGLLFSHAVDGYVCASPLVMTNVTIPGKGQHNVVFVATEHDSVYAFDADNATGANASPLWSTSFLNVAGGITTVTPGAVLAGSFDAGIFLTPSTPEVGITGTPVIDPVTGTLYVEAETQELIEGIPVVFHWLHALDVGTGAEKFGGPVEISPSVSGIGDNSVGGVVSFNAANQFNGSALLLANGNVYIAFSSPDQTPPFQGWLLSYNAQTLQPTGIFNTAPNGSQAGIWMSGGGPAADAAGNIYLTTSGGTFSTNYASAKSDSLGGSFVKLETTNGLAEADYFRPYNESTLESFGASLGVTGVALLPDSAGSAAHPHLMVSAQESGTLYLVDRDSLGGYNASGDSRIPQELSTVLFTAFNGTPAYFNNQLFFQGDYNNIHSVFITNGQMVYSNQSANSFIDGGVPAVSANGNSNGIVWTVQFDNYATGGPAVLYAYNANNLSQELYDSSQAPLRDRAFPAVQFTSPTIAGGRVYVGGQYGLSVYGAGPFAELPVITPPGGVVMFTNSETVTISASTPGATLYFTLDGSTPTTNSQVYTGPFAVTNTVIVNALDYAPGYIAGAAHGPTLVNVSLEAQAPGLVIEAVYPGATRAQLESSSYTNPPAYVRHLPSFEIVETGGGNFAETLTGWFTPPQTGNYVFFVASGADADLFLSTDATSANLHLIAQETSASNTRSWLSSYGGSVVSSKRSDQFAGTAWPTGNTITLTAGVPYLMKAVHHSVPTYVSTFAATYKLAGAPDPANGTAPALTGSVLSSIAEGNAAISVSGQPQNAVIYAGDEAEFTVQATATYFADAPGGSGPPISYQWQSAPPGSTSFTNIAGATNFQFVASAPATAANGFQFQVAISAPAAPTLVSSIATLSVKPAITTPNYDSVLTWHYDNARTGQYTNETVLTLTNVNSNSFGVVATHAVDGYVYAEPLILTNVMIPGLGSRNVLFVVTDHDSVYAFDADSVATGTNAGLLWQTSFINPAAGVTIAAQADFNYDFTGPAGIIATPVIDPVSGTIYIEALTKESLPGGTNFIHRLHALDVTTGSERSNSPVVIQCTNYPGTGATGFQDNDGNGHVAWNPLLLQARPALLLAGGSVYVSFASYADVQPYHGWILGYDAATLTNTGVFNVTPNGASGGIWMSGAGLAADQYNNIYTPTGNGDFGTNYALASSYNLSESVIKLATTNGLALLDYFTPYNQAFLTSKDLDLSSDGVMLLPASAGSALYPHLMVSCAKEGKIYLLNRDSLGHYNAFNDNQIVQEVPNAVTGTWASPAYFNNMIYYQAGTLGGPPDVLKAFAITNGQITPTPVTESLTPFNFPGATPVISANGVSNAIAWVLQEESPQSSPCVLHAYNATNLSQELYNSKQADSRDLLGVPVKQTIPTVFHGKVYVGAAYSVYVLGINSFIPEPLIAPAGGLFTNSINITLSDAGTNVSIYYTLDGSKPTTNSALYSGPFVLTNTALVQAAATVNGSSYSPVASASFVNTAAAGNGTGLLGQYYAGIFPTNIPTGAPLMVRTDAVINFNWSAAPPSSALGYIDYSIFWTGMVRPQYSENYTFSVTADDGVSLSVNGQPLILQWHDKKPTTWSATIPMQAQQYYNIVLGHYQDTNNEQISLSWQSPSTPLAVVPQSQLYPLTNPPPAVALTAPAAGSTYTASAAITISAAASDQFNEIASVAFYTNGSLAGVVSNAPYSLTVTDVPAGSYNLVAVASDTAGITSASAPVSVTVAAGSGAGYGLSTNGALAPFLNQNMPGAFNGVFTGTIPAVLSATGTYADLLNRVPSAGLLPYSPNTILWSDGATKSRYMALPNIVSPIVPSEQIGFAPTGQWTFPSGTVFVKNFDLVVNTTNASIPLRRLETRLLVRDTNGSVYGVTYKWRPDNSDADLLTNSLTEAISITNASGVTTQNWYYPSPADCLTCHTPVAGYVLGVNTRQLNGANFYPATGVSDNQLRTMNHLGMFNPAFDEAAIAAYEYMSAITNTGASLAQRARSYLDANCAQCHQPGGTGPTFDARYDTPLTNQNIIGVLAAKANFGYNNVDIVSPHDIWRSAIYQRINTVDPTIKMPPLARNIIDTNAVDVFTDWINSLPGTPAEAPPVIAPAAGAYAGPLTVTIQPPDANATIYYTLDGSLPTTNSFVYTGPFDLTNSATVSANAAESGLITSVAPSATYKVVPGVSFVEGGVFADGYFIMQMAGPVGQAYTIQTSTNLINWTSVLSITPDSTPFVVAVPQTTNSHARFYRAVQSQ